MMLQPKWFKILIWSWLTHEKKGVTNEYPFHLFICGPPAGGKSTLMNILHEHSMESQPLFTGSTSTLKALIPSFKEIHVKRGYLADSDRYGFIDEFLRCIQRTTMPGAINEELATMNDLLEHQKRRAASGVSSENINMTARMLSCTNPPGGISDMNGMLKKYDKSFLSRWMIYMQTDLHVNMIKKADPTELGTSSFRFEPTDFVSFMDYLHTFGSKYDMKRVQKIYKEPIELFDGDMKDHYTSRHLHHIECLMDGIVKTRCFTEFDESFEAKEEDYDTLADVWANIIRSWIESARIETLPIERRKYYVPENSRYIFDEIDSPKTREEIEAIALKYMNKSQYYNSIEILRNILD